MALYEDVKVKEDTLAAAERLYSDTKAQVEEGTQAQIELTRANAQVFSIRQDLINARGLLEEQEAIVKIVITRRSENQPDILNARIVPTDSLNMPEKDDLSPSSESAGRSVPEAARPQTGRRPGRKFTNQPGRFAQRVCCRSWIWWAWRRTTLWRANRIHRTARRSELHRRIRQRAGATGYAQVSDLRHRPAVDATAPQS